MSIPSPSGNTIVDIANGSTTAFPFPYRVFADTDLVVTTTDTLGNVVIKTLGTDYTVANTGTNSGATVNFGVAPASGLVVTVQRILPLDQPSQWVNIGPFDQPALEAELDRLCLQIQQINQGVQQAITIPASDIGINTVLPVASLRANNILAFDGTGNPVMTPTVGSSTAVALAAAAAAAVSATNAAASAASALAAVATISPFDANQYASVTGATSVWATSISNLAALSIGTQLSLYFSSIPSAASTLNVNGFGALPLQTKRSAMALGDIATSQTAKVILDGSGWQIENPTPVTAPAVIQVPVRQTVLGGPVDANGFPSFLPSTAVALSLTSQNVTSTASLVVASANGFDANGASNRVGISTANITWASLTASSTLYLYVDISATGVLTPGFTTLAPTYQFGGTRSVTNNQFTFNIQEMRATVGNGTVANQAYRVYVGEAVTSGSAVTSTVGYAYQGSYESAVTATFPGSGVAISYNHNLGVKPRIKTFLATCLTADQGYSVGDEIEDFYTGTALVVLSKWVTKNTGGFTHVNTTGTGAVNKSSGAALYLTDASWNYRMIFQRGW